MICRAPVPSDQGGVRAWNRDQQRRLRLTHRRTIDHPLPLDVVPFERRMELERDQHVLSHDLQRERSGITTMHTRGYRNDVATDQVGRQMSHPNKGCIFGYLGRRGLGEETFHLGTQVAQFFWAKDLARVDQIGFILSPSAQIRPSSQNTNPPELHAAGLEPTCPARSP